MSCVEAVEQMVKLAKSEEKAAEFYAREGNPLPICLPFCQNL